MTLLFLLLTCGEVGNAPTDTFQSIPMAPPDTSEPVWVHVAGGQEPAPVEIILIQAQVHTQEQEVDRLNRELDEILLQLKQRPATASKKPLR